MTLALLVLPLAPLLNEIEEGLGPRQHREQQAGEDAEGAYGRQGQTFHNRTREWRA